MIEITHSRAEGTLADGTSKGDAAGPILRASGFRWGGSIGMWYVQHSRGKAPGRVLIERARAALEAAGFKVSVSIDAETVPDAAAREAERIGRAEGRAGYFGERAERLAAQSDALWERGHQATAAIPTGQPILVGHHSERGHRRALAKRDRLEEQAVEANAAAKRAAGRADAAGRYQAAREDLSTTLRRIDRLEADIRRVRRALAEDSGRNPDWAADRRADVAQWEAEVDYWREHVAAREAAGEKVWGPGDFTKGDRVLVHGMWLPVLRVNRRSLTIPNPYHEVLDNATLPYDKVRGRRPPATDSAGPTTATGEKTS